MSLEDRLDQDDEFWDPAEGDQVVGRVISVTEFTGKFNTFPVLRVLTKDGLEQLVSMGRSALKGAFEDYDISVGDEIGIRYLGLKKTKDGSSEYHAYKVVVDKAAGSTAPPAVSATAAAPDAPVTGPPAAPAAAAPSPEPAAAAEEPDIF